MLEAFQKIEILQEILPFIRKFSGSTIVVKYGGSAMKDPNIKSKVLDDILFLYAIGIKVILVHGGGPMINYWLDKLHIQPKFRDGIRVTDYQTMEIVEMVLVGQVNQDLVTLLNKKINFAIGLSGKDGNLVTASKLFDSRDNFVGKVDAVNTQILRLLMDSNYIPVIATVATDINGQTYNINADTFASSIAVSLSAEKLILLTDTLGIMHDMNNPNTLIKDLNIHEAQKLQHQQVITGGMIPKVECCINALQGNVKAAHIIDGKINHALLLEIFTSNRSGSMITL